MISTLQDLYLNIPLQFELSPDCSLVQNESYFETSIIRRAPVYVHSKASLNFLETASCQDSEPNTTVQNWF